LALEFFLIEVITITTYLRPIAVVIKLIMIPDFDVFQVYLILVLLFLFMLHAFKPLLLSLFSPLLPG